MLQLDNIYINAEIYDILMLLRTHLSLKGINLLQQIKQGRDNIQITCPHHANGQEKRPSCGIRTTASEDTEVGQVHCFTCGYTVTLPVFISNCFGKYDNGNYGRKWLLKHFSGESDISNRKIDLNLNRASFRASSGQHYISEEELESYRYTHPYMYKRGLTDEIIEKYDIGYDKDSDCITMPIRDEKGRTLFFCRRSVKTKFFNYPSGVEKPIYGIYELPKDCKEIVVCESVFNALTCVKYGKPAIALLGTGTHKQLIQLKKLSTRLFILATDKDEAGKNARIKIRKYLKNKIVKEFDYNSYPEHCNDINDMTKDEFDNLQII